MAITKPQSRQIALDAKAELDAAQAALAQARDAARLAALEVKRLEGTSSALAEEFDLLKRRHRRLFDEDA